MALSIKLSIIKTLDIVTRTEAGLQHFLGELSNENGCDLMDGSTKNAYEKVLELMASAKETRAKVKKYYLDFYITKNYTNIEFILLLKLLFL